MGALFCAVTGGISVFSPQRWFEEIGPLKPMLDAEARSAQSEAVVRFVGGLLLFMACVLYVVRWNTINGKAAALGCVIIAGQAVSVARSLERNIASGWYVFAVGFFLLAVHLAINANPMLTSAMLLEKEKARAARAKAK